MEQICAVIGAVMCLGRASVSMAQVQAGAAVAPVDQVPVPVSTSWLGVVLLGLMWLLIAAIILGPLVRFFAHKMPPEPRNLPTVY